MIFLVNREKSSTESSVLGDQSVETRPISKNL